MYFWAVDKLVEDFQNDDVTEEEKFKYILFFSVVYTVGSYLMLWAGIDEYSMMDFMDFFIILIIVIGGTYYCYVSNRGADNKDFVTRFVCIGMPILVRVFVIAVPIVIVIAVVEVAYDVGVKIDESGKEIYTTTISMVVVNALLSIYYYWYLGNKLKSVASDRNP